MTTREQKLIEIFKSLNLIAVDLILIVVRYAKEVPWLGTKVQEIKSPKSCRLTTDQKYLYVSMYEGLNGFCARYTIDTLQLIDKFAITSYAFAVDLSGNELYLGDNRVLKVFDINTKAIIRQWNTPAAIIGIKRNGEKLYCTCSNHIIYVYNYLSGSLIKEFGKSGKGNGECSYPRGIDIDDKFIYINDSYNHRVQVFNLENCTYSHQWGSRGNENGQMEYPCGIRLYCGLMPEVFKCLQEMVNFFIVLGKLFLVVVLMNLVGLEVF